MCHLSMKLSDTFDQNPPCTFVKYVMYDLLTITEKGQQVNFNHSQRFLASRNKISTYNFGAK